jgi:pimeloyl-ACP methyl ester carboxylesterase
MTRRRFLLSTAAVTTGVSLGVTGSVAAGTGACQFPSSPDDYPFIEGETQTVHGDFPDTTDELTIFINGYLSDDFTEPGEDQGHVAATNAAANGYTPSAIHSDAPYSIVTWAWDSFGTWAGMKWKAENQGTALAHWLHDTYRPDNPDTCVRLLGHSLGARVVVSCLRTLDTNNWESVRTAALLGGAIDDQSVAVDGQWGPYIAAATNRLNNYYKTNDQTLDDSYETREWSKAVGEVGCDGTPPRNYTDHNVTKEVEDHCTYVKEGNVMPVVVNNWSFPCG